MFGRPMLRKPVAWKTDLIIIVVLAVVILPAAGRLDVFEYLIDELKIHDRWHGGDLLITAVFLAVAASIFSLRRSWELARIVNERESAPAETRVATGQPARPLPAASEAPSVRQPLNILLAEDNPVNQRVAVSMLEKRGHVVQSVLNGREALEALACERFDVVLMDVQMPEINGLQAAAAIRQKEEHDGHHVPIIAMTAHALDGDRERCLAAGMDDYLTKPVKAEALSAALDRWAAPRRCPEQAEEADNRAPEELTRSRSPGEPPPSTPGKSNFSADVFDMTALRERVEDDLDLLAEIIGLSLESSPLLMSEIQSAVSAGDFDKSTRDAHTLKGALKNMCAGRCAEAAQEMETAGESKDAERAEQALAHLNDEFERLHSALTEVAGEVNA